jgi:hypothetical protein
MERCGKNGKCVFGRGLIASAATGQQHPRWINNAPPDEILFIVGRPFNFRLCLRAVSALGIRDGAIFLFRAGGLTLAIVNFNSCRMNRKCFGSPRVV